MALGYRVLRATWESYEGQGYLLDIIDSEALAINSRETELDGLEFAVEGQSKINDWIHPANVTFSLNVKNTDIENFILSLVAGDENRFYVKVFETGGINTTIFTGSLISDNFIDPDTKPYSVEMVATDGLSLLKNKDYADEGTPFTGRETFAKVINRALNLVPATTYQLGQRVLRTAVNWYEVQMPNTTKDPLEWTQVDHRIFDKRKLSEDEPEFYTAWEVLELCCIRWKCRLFYWRNQYHFFHTNIYENSTFTVYEYTLGSGTSFTSSTFDPEVLVRDATNTASDNHPKEGGQFSYYYPLKRAIMNWRRSSINYLRDANWNNLDNTSFTVGDIDTTSGNVKMILRGRFVATITDPAIAVGDPLEYPVRAVFQMRVKVGTYHLKRTAEGTFQSPKYDEKNGTWLNSTEFFEVVSDAYFINGDTLYEDISIQTEALPNIGVESWVVDQVAIRWMADGGGGLAIYAPDIEWRLDNPIGYLYDDQNPFKVKDVTKIVATNPQAHSREEEYSIDFGDEPNGWSVDRLTVWNGTAWVDSENWQVAATGTQYSINKLVVLSIASLQPVPVRFRRGGWITRHIHPYSRINYQGWNLICTQMKFDAVKDEVEGEFFDIAQDETGVVITTELTQRDRFPTATTAAAERGPEDYSIYTGPFHGMVKNNVTAGAQTSIPIMTADYSFLKKDDVITIWNKYTGVNEELTVTADVAAAATSISVSGTLTNDYPAGALIFLSYQSLAANLPRAANTLVSNFDNQTGAFIATASPTSGTAPVLPDASALTTEQVNKRLKVFRHGVKLRYRGEYSAPFTDYGYKIDNANNRLYIFPELAAEDIEVENINI